MKLLLSGFAILLLTGCSSPTNSAPWPSKSVAGDWVFESSPMTGTYLSKNGMRRDSSEYVCQMKGVMHLRATTPNAFDGVADQMMLQCTKSGQPMPPAPLVDHSVQMGRYSESVPGQGQVSFELVPADCVSDCPQGGALWTRLTGQLAGDRIETGFSSLRIDGAGNLSFYDWSGPLTLTRR